MNGRQEFHNDSLMVVSVKIRSISTCAIKVEQLLFSGENTASYNAAHPFTIHGYLSRVDDDESSLDVALN